MKSNYDRSKTIIRETTKNYHPRANDPPLLLLQAYHYWGFKKRMKSYRLPGYNCTMKICLTTPIGFPLEKDFCLLRPWLRYRNTTKREWSHSPLISCFDCLFIYFSIFQKLKRKIFEPSPSSLHHTFLLGRALFTAQLLSALVATAYIT